MRLTIRRLGGIVQYEIVQHWRRRGLPLTMLIWLGAVLLGVYVVGEPPPGGPPGMEAAAELFARLQNTSRALTAAMSVSTIFCVLALGVMAAETFPLETQQGVDEWRDALPLGDGLFLAGKVGGVWTAVIAGLLAVMLLSAAALRLLIGPFDLPAYFKLWLLGLAPVALFVSGVSALLASLFASRRWAMLLGITVSVFCYVFLLTGLLDVMMQIQIEYMAWQYPLIRAAVCAQSAAPCDLPAQFDYFAISFSSMSMGRMLLIYAGVLLASGLFAYGWRLWRVRR